MLGSWTRPNTDGLVCAYQNWMAGKPDNVEVPNSMCTVFTPEGTWDDLDCEDTTYVRIHIAKCQLNCLKSCSYALLKSSANGYSMASLCTFAA